MEAINRGRAFLETARAIIPHKPIVVFYSGGSEEGKRASFSHTGAMAGSDQIYDGVFRQSGIIRANSITELFDFCWVLGSQPRARGSRVVIETQSGGPGAAAADACGRFGLQLPSLSPETIEKLTPIVPHTGSVSNPVDMTFFKEVSHYFYDLPKILLEDNEVDMLVIYFLLPTQVVEQTLSRTGLPREKVLIESRKLIDDQAESVARVAASSGKPLVGYTFRGFGENLIKGLVDRGVPVFPDPQRAVRALKALVDYTHARGRILSVG